MQHVFRLMVVISLHTIFPGAAAAAGPGNSLEQITSEQATVAMEMLAFMTDTEKNFWQRVDKFNGRSNPTSQVWDVPDNGHYEVRLKRGEVLEKAGVMTVMTTVEKPPFIRGGQWNRFIELAVHPKTPLVGMLHATFSVQVSSEGIGNIGATMDMMKAAQPPEDLEYMDQQVKEVFARHGADREMYRSRACGKPNEGPWKWRRPGTCTGVSMYGPEMLADDKTFALVSDLYTTVMETYFELVGKRVRQRFPKEALEAQDFMRRRWLEDQLFWDALSKNFVPYEAWSAVNAPPVVKF